MQRVEQGRIVIRGGNSHQGRPFVEKLAPLVIGVGLTLCIASLLADFYVSWELRVSIARDDDPPGTRHA